MKLAAQKTTGQTLYRCLDPSNKRRQNVLCFEILYKLQFFIIHFFQFRNLNSHSDDSNDPGHYQSYIIDYR